MSTEEIFGSVAALVTLIYTCIGLPTQIRENHRNRATKGLSLPMYVMSFLTFSVWVAYGFVKKQPDWYIIASNAAGSFFVAVVLWQFWLYRAKR